MVREDIFNYTGFQFGGTFFYNCQQDCANMLLNGSSIKNQDFAESQSCLTISQNILFNCKRKSSKATQCHHSKNLNHHYLCILGLRFTHTQDKKSWFQRCISWVFQPAMIKSWKFRIRHLLLFVNMPMKLV